MAHEIIDLKTLHEGWSRLLALRIRLADGRVMKREVEDHGGAVGVLPYDPSRRVAMLVRQFRAAVFHAGGEAEVLEAPAGLLEEDGLRRIVFEDGDALECQALFYTYGEREPSPLVEKLGCELTDKGVVETRSYERTNVPGLYAAGDASRRVQFAIIAAAEGAAAAFAINTELYKEDFQ